MLPPGAPGGTVFRRGALPVLQIPAERDVGHHPRPVDDGAGCTNKLAPMTHIFEASTGDSREDPQVTAATTGATYTRTTVSRLAP